MCIFYNIMHCMENVWHKDKKVAGTGGKIQNLKDVFIKQLFDISVTTEFPHAL